MKKPFPLILALIALLISVWFYFTPHLTLKNMKSAVDNKSVEQLAEYVDFPRLRESLKVRLNTKLGERATREGQSREGLSPPLSGLSGALFSKMVDPMVDTLITPTSLMAILKGGAMALSKPAPDSQGESGSKRSDKVPNASLRAESIQDVSMSYEGFNRFSATVKKTGSNDAPLTIYLQRQGLVTWKLVDVSLPF
jgi:Protein of unknown function (DUF2939)